MIVSSALQKIVEQGLLIIWEPMALIASKYDKCVLA